MLRDGGADRTSAWAGVVTDARRRASTLSGSDDRIVHALCIDHTTAHDRTNGTVTSKRAMQASMHGLVVFGVCFGRKNLKLDAFNNTDAAHFSANGRVFYV